MVLAAGQRGSPAATEALENLCRTYWYPLYAYIRRRGSGHEDAQDLTQGFLLQLLEHDAFNRVEQSRGRFRSFLLASLKYYLADQRDHADLGDAHVPQCLRFPRPQAFGSGLDFLPG